MIQIMMIVRTVKTLTNAQKRVRLMLLLYANFMARFRIVHHKPGRFYYIERKDSLLSKWKLIEDECGDGLIFRNKDDVKEKLREISGLNKKRKEVVYQISV